MLAMMQVEDRSGGGWRRKKEGLDPRTRRTETDRNNPYFLGYISVDLYWSTIKPINSFLRSETHHEMAASSFQGKIRVLLRGARAILSRGFRSVGLRNSKSDKVIQSLYRYACVLCGRADATLYGERTIVLVFKLVLRCVKWRGGTKKLHCIACTCWPLSPLCLNAQAEYCVTCNVQAHPTFETVNLHVCVQYTSTL
jgi:hypothetical protein